MLDYGYKGVGGLAGRLVRGWVKLLGGVWVEVGW